MIYPPVSSDDGAGSGVPSVNSITDAVTIAGTERIIDVSTASDTITLTAQRLNPAQRVIINADFVLTGVLPMNVFVANSGSGALDGNSFLPDHPGVALLQTNAETNGVAGLTTTIFAVTGGSYFASYIKLAALSDGTNTYTFHTGYGNQPNINAFSNGYNFRYSSAVSPNWYRCTQSQDGTETATDTGVAVTTDWVYLECQINDDLTSVEFFIDGVSVGSNTTNIPTNTRFQYGITKIIKTAGTTNRTVSVDLNYFDIAVAR